VHKLEGRVADLPRCRPNCTDAGFAILRPNRRWLFGSREGGGLDPARFGVLRNKTRPLRLGILTNEVFSTDVGRMGGFGWAVQQVSRCFADDPALGVDVIILMGEKPRGNARPRELHASRVLWPRPIESDIRVKRLLQRFIRLQSERIDLLLCIDYYPNYSAFIQMLPNVPVVIWVRDPWDGHDHREIATLRIPGQPDLQPQGLGQNYSNIRRVARMRRFIRRPLLFATTTPFLATRAAEAYGLDPMVVRSLPNIISPVDMISKSPRATVAFLGRLDPIKRPWVFAALAERFPHVEFIFMGQSHFRGPGSWKPCNLPANVRLLGHVNEVEKRELLSKAWLLVNTSIHEGLAVSFLEALACETPLLACVDPEGIVSRFGAFIGNYSGTGLEAVPVLESAMRELLSDSERRARLGAEGRAWVTAIHDRASFLRALSDIWAHASST